MTILLTFLGAAAAAVIASGADPAQSGKVALITLAVFLGSGGSNGLTNYLDRALGRAHEPDDEAAVSRAAALCQRNAASIGPPRG